MTNLFFEASLCKTDVSLFFPDIKHLLELAERNAHLKENSTKSHLSFFLCKQDGAKLIKIISVKDFSTIVAS